MTPLHSQILTARDRNGQELRTIQKQLQKLPPGKLICSRNGTTVKWYQGDGHSKTYIPKANRALAEQLALKKYLQQQEQMLLQEQAAITAYLKYSPRAASLPMIHIFSLIPPVKICFILIFPPQKIFRTSRMFQISRIFRIVPLARGSAYLRHCVSAPSRLVVTNRSAGGAIQVPEAMFHAAPPIRTMPTASECGALPWRHHTVSGVHQRLPEPAASRRTVAMCDGTFHLRQKSPARTFLFYAENGIIPSVSSWIYSRAMTKHIPVNARRIDNLWIRSRQVSGSASGSRLISYTAVFLSFRSLLWGLNVVMFSPTRKCTIVRACTCFLLPDRGGIVFFSCRYFLISSTLGLEQRFSSLRPIIIKD